MVTLSILDLILIFIIFCIVWILTSYAWRIIENKVLVKRQDELIDAAYAKAIRILLKAVQDYKGIKEVIYRDDQM